MKRLFLSLLFAATIAAPHGWPQNTVRRRPPSTVAGTEGASGNFQVDSTLVLVNVSVTDSHGRFVTGLARRDFQVFEEKTPQPVAYFSSEEAPISVGLVLDFSASMASRFGRLQDAVSEFLKTTNPQDELCLIEFRDEAELSMGFTGAPEEIQRRVASTEPDGKTALLDAVYMGLRQSRRARNSRKILLIVSDGGDNHSRYRARDVVNLARESDVEIYAIGVLDRSTSGWPYAMLEGPDLLNELADQAGGRYYEINDSHDLPAVAEKIGRELRHQYVLGYVPSHGRGDGRYRHIQVKIARAPAQPRLSVYWKRGYYAPEY